MAKSDKVCMELVFSRGTSRSKQAKVRDFWMFLDGTNNVHPLEKQSDPKHSRTTKAVGEGTARPEAKSGQRLWYDKLKVLQELGLDRVAIATGETCKFYQGEGRYRSLNYADTVKQSYEELNEEMKAFDRRLSNSCNK